MFVDCGGSCHGSKLIVELEQKCIARIVSSRMLNKVANNVHINYVIVYFHIVNYVYTF